MNYWTELVHFGSMKVMIGLYVTELSYIAS